MILSNSISNANLFKVLDSIRGKYTISDLEEYIVSLFFLKYIKIESANNKFVYDESIDIFNNDFLEHKANFLNGGINLNYVFQIIEKDNPELKGTFSNFDLNFNSRIKEFDTVLNDLIKIISNLDFESENFGGFFDLLLNSIVNSKGKGFDSFQPQELTDLMLSFLPKKDNLSIYNPFSGFSSLGLNLPENSFYYGEEHNKRVFVYSKLRLIAHRVINQNIIHNIDVFKSWRSNDVSFDSIVTNPPFNLKLNDFDDQFDVDDRFYIKNNANSFIVSQCYKRLNQNGKAIIVISNGFLSSSNSKEKSLKEYLVKEGAIEMIISLPSDILNYTSIAFSLIVLTNSDKKINPLFIDASDCFIQQSKNTRTLDLEKIYSLINSENNFKKRIELNQIISNNYNLTINRYFISEYDGVKFGDLVSLVQGKRINESDNNIGKLVTNRHLKSNSIDFKLSTDELEELQIPRNVYKFDESCLLISTSNKNIKPTYFEYLGTSIYLFRGILAFNIKQSIIDLEYLINELNSDYVLEQIKSLSSGSVISLISSEDLLNIKINVPSINEQKAKVEGIKQAYIESKKKELAYQQELLGLKDESFREFASIKHTFRQYLNALKSNVAGTRLFVQNNCENGISLDTIYSKNLNKTFGEHLFGLEGTITSMSKLLTSFDSSTNDNLIKDLDLILLVEEAQNRFKNSELFQFDKVFFDEESFTLGDDSILAPMITMNDDDFYRVFSNIISNAIDHGFKDSKKKYIIRTSISFDENERMCILEISNNGKAMPKGFTVKELTTSGEKTTDSSGTGMGGADIKNILKKYKGVVDLVNDESEEFPVTYIIKLPLLTLNL